MSLFEPIPSAIEESSNEPLEWNRLLELVASYAESGIARDWLLRLKPSSDPAWIANQHRLVQEMGLLAARNAAPSLAQVFDPSQLAARARLEGAILEAAEIRDLLARR